MYNHVASLISMSETLNTYGDPTNVTSASVDVFCKVTSADEKEKAFAESRGQNAELVVILPDKTMYQGQEYLTLDGTQYRVTDRKFTDASKEIRLVVGQWAAH